MTLRDYLALIKCLPYMEQAFETKKGTWHRECRANRLFNDYCDSIFTGDMLKLSRQDVFNSANEGFEQGLFSIILWGYPRNMRGNSFLSILNSLESIRPFFSNNKSLTHDDFFTMMEKLKGTHIGLSTISKALYFFQFTIDNKQCLILDSRIIEVINRKVFSELAPIGRITEFNKHHRYNQYLNEISIIAENFTCQPDQVEQFLFLFGKNFLKKC